MIKVREFRKYIREIEREVEHQLKSQTGCCGVTLPQCHALMELDDMGPVGIIDLAKRLRLDTSTLSRTVDSLVREGFVERNVNPENRRFVIVNLTDRGQAKADEINGACDRFYHDLLDGFPESHSVILETVKRLSELLSSRKDGICCERPGGKF